jgi:protein disulfide-isomerase
MTIQELKSNDFKINGENVSIINGKGPGLLLIHAKWCGHCVKFMPIYKKLSERLGNDFQCSAIEESYLNSELSQNLKVEGFPTLKFYDQNNRIIGNYTGNRKESDILTEICKVYHHCIEYH